MNRLQTNDDSSRVARRTQLKEKEKEKETVDEDEVILIESKNDIIVIDDDDDNNEEETIKADNPSNIECCISENRILPVENETANILIPTDNNKTQNENLPLTLLKANNQNLTLEDISNTSLPGQISHPMFYECRTPGFDKFSNKPLYFSTPVNQSKKESTSTEKLPQKSQAVAQRNNLDDSVIFVSEVKCPSFIPLPKTIKKTKSKALLSRVMKKYQKKKLLNSGLINGMMDKAKLVTAYNPSGQTESPGLRMIVVDGSNVAFSHTLGKGFSVKGLDICIKFFELKGHEVKAIVPQFRMKKAYTTDQDLLQKLHQDGKIILTPCKNLNGVTSASYDDRFILQVATEFDAAIISNDNFSDLMSENPEWEKLIRNRVIGYSWCKDMFIVPNDPYGLIGPTLSEILYRQ